MKRVRRIFFATLIVLAVISLDFGASDELSALAQASTPTVTRTATITAPPPYQPQVNLTLPTNFDCPIGLPVGWGTVTPQAGWEIFCSQCVGVPYGTNTPGTPSPTVTVTGTPPTATVTATVTVTPTGTVAPNELTLTWTDFFYDSGSIQDTDHNSSGSSGDSLADWYFYVTGTAISNPFGAMPTGNFRNMGFLATVSGTLYISIHYTSNFTTTQAGFYDGFPACSGAPCATTLVGGGTDTDVERNYSMTGGTTYSVGGLGLYASGAFSGCANVHCSASVWYHLSFVPGQSAFTPTPQATATVAATAYPSFCAAVNGGDAYSNIDTQGISWTGIATYNLSCFDLGPTHFTLFSYDWDIPWLAHICLQEIDIGNLNVFGVGISLLVTVYALGVAWVLRNMFIS